MSSGPLLESTNLWYSVAVVLFIAVFFWKAWKPVAGWLDSEIVKIRAELDEAKRLHAEAEATLKDYKARKKVAEEEAKHIVAQAQKDAARLREEAEHDVQQELKRHETLALNRIKLAQAEALVEVRNYVIEEVMREVKGKAASGGASQNAELVDNIIADITKLKPKSA